LSADSAYSTIAASTALDGRRPWHGHAVELLVRDRTATIGAVLVGWFALATVFGPLASPHDPNAVDVLDRFAGLSLAHPLGTDNLGRDLLSRLLNGARTSVVATVIAATGIATLGLLLGSIAGYVGGLVDLLISRVMDILLAFPTFLLALAVTGVLGPSLPNVIIAVVAVWWAGYARITRGAVLAERQKPYVEAARATGTREWRILARHMLPNIVAPLVVLTTLDMGAILLGIAGLSFLGLGVRPPTPEWGSMLAEGKTYIGVSPAMTLLPGTCIFLLVLGFNLLGDGIRDLLDPRLRRAGRGSQA
jgi:peptide/nickel transport system permease protein